MPRRQTTTEFIAAAIARHSDRYDYSATHYVGSRAPVTIICRDHGPFTQTPADHIHAGAGCPVCAGNKAISLDTFLTDAARIHGARYDYSRVKLTNNTTPVPIICQTHGEFLQSPKMHRNGHGCPQCGRTAKLDTPAAIARFVAAHGNQYDYSRVEYTSASKPVTIVCPTHGEFAQRAASHWRGNGCPKCAKHSLGQSLRLDTEKVVTEATALGYTCDASSYTNNKAPIPMTCPNGHATLRPLSAIRKYGCPMCVSQVSSGEQELREFIESLGVTCERTRKVIPPKEIDIWCPDHNVGFEFNGTYWHSDAYPRARRRHIDKTKAMADAGARLVHIWSDDWELRRTAVEHMVRARLGKLPQVAGRKCRVAPVGAAQAKAFLNTYHLQGWVPGEYVGLYLGGDLVACMGFAVARSVRGNRDAGLWELLRYCAKVRVTGGGSKLLAAWLRQDRAWHKLVTYCDLAQFDGGLYKGMGFTLAKTYGPDYRVVTATDGRRRHKSMVQKAKLKTLLGDKFDPSKSESKLCAENNIFRLWDCGKARYELVRHQ